MSDDDPHFARAPFPWFGGKSKAAPLVWSMLGDVAHYVEPFFGSGAVLLGRPHPCNRPYHSETVNDIDAVVVNFWRAAQWAPDLVAQAASWPVTEFDKRARQIACERWKAAGGPKRLEGDAGWYDPVIAGWWAYGVSCQIGAIGGPWTADPRTGVNTVSNRVGGVSGNRPQLVNNGIGVNIQTARLPGVLDVPAAHHADAALDAVDWGEYFHDRTMPRLIKWLRFLSARLRHVRVVNGDWARVCTGGALRTLSVRMGKGGVAGVFLDPPYADTAGRSYGLYQHDSLTVAHDVREWCLANGNEPDYRIVLAGFEGEHGSALVDAGWREYEWFKAGFLTGGMGNTNRRKRSDEPKHQQKRERLWASPNCLIPGDDAATTPEPGLFGGEESA